MARAVQKDVVLAITGGLAALAGLVLVFVGILVTGFQTLLGRSPERTLARFKLASWLGMLVFAEALATLAVSTSWLVVGGGHSFYVAVVVLFFVQLGALAGIAGYATARVLLRG